MRRRSSGVLRGVVRFRAAFVGAVLLALAGCGRGRATATETVQVGHHRVRFSSPRGWEHLDHGREQLFRNGETELRLEDLGAATPPALAREIAAARATWLAGRRRDAIARMREIDGLPLAFLPSQARADFWRPWTDVAYAPDVTDSAALGAAFAAMHDGAAALPALTTDQLVESVLERRDDAARREIDRRDTVAVHGASWLAIETWSRVSHLDRRRVAFVVHDGDLLQLTTERGLPEATLGAFDSLLATIELLPAAR